MARRALQEINAGSMADIAFLLLIFFLMTTTMDTDSGITRRLPPMPEQDQPEDDQKVRERNVFVVLVNKDDQLFVEGEVIDIKDLREKAKEFLLNPENREDLPEKQKKIVDYFGEIEVTKGVISLRNDIGTSYGKYLQVQNELTAAGNELKNEISMRKFGKPYDELDEDMAEAVREVMPVMISEAEPVKIGGKNP